MGSKHKIAGGFIAVVGFMLSPLSWWNDLFVNIPLAVGFAWVVSLIYKPAFEASLILGYLLTNMLGFVLMHFGARKVLANPADPPKRHRWLADIAVAAGYTAIVVILVRVGVLKPIQNYFDRPGAG
jgi:hypothetical protein